MALSPILFCNLCHHPVDVYGKLGAKLLTRCSGCGLDSATLKDVAPAPQQQRPKKKRRAHEGVEIIRLRR